MDDKTFQQFEEFIHSKSVAIIGTSSSAGSASNTRPSMSQGSGLGAKMNAVVVGLTQIHQTTLPKNHDSYTTSAATSSNANRHRSRHGKRHVRFVRLAIYPGPSVSGTIKLRRR